LREARAQGQEGAEGFGQMNDLAWKPADWPSFAGGIIFGFLLGAVIVCVVILNLVASHIR
jgi:hypothetical protein